MTEYEQPKAEERFCLKGPEYRRLLAAEHKLNFLIEEITDREGREGMTDADFAEQVIALAQNIRAAFQLNAARVSHGSAEMQATHAMEDRKIESMLAVLKAVDHTLSVHGHMDCDTPLHDRIQKTIMQEERSGKAAFERRRT